jgi:HTH-type transcriptional regulator/antitoxin HipB
MIKNEKQYAITKTKREEFVAALNEIEPLREESLFNQIMIDSLNSQIETFDKEIREYEYLRSEKPNIFVSTIVDLPEALIKARLIQNLSQGELAKRVGLKEQQIQRYEASSYQTANFEKILSIAKSMNVEFEDTKVLIQTEKIIVEGYDNSFIESATRKLHARKNLLCF